MVDTTGPTDVAAIAAAPPEFAAVGRRWSIAARRWPVLPLVILVPFVLMALFADYLAPYDPTEPIPGAKIFEPPFWMQGGSAHALLGTDFQARDLLSRLIFGARVSRRLGRPGDHAGDRRLARPSRPGLCDLSGDDGRPQHVEHRPDTRSRLLDPLCPRDPRRSTQSARAR